MTIKFLTGVILCTILGVSPSFALQNITGTVVEVVDGDTIKVEDRQGVHIIRLADIDCPEKDQPFGAEATEYTRGHVQGQTVTVIAKGLDRNRRILGEVVLPGGRNINCRLVESGLAWWYQPGSSNRTIEQVERQARSEKTGLWADQSPVPPWQHRKLERRSATISQPRAATVWGGQSAAAIPKDPDGTAIGSGGGFGLSESPRTPAARAGELNVGMILARKINQAFGFTTFSLQTDVQNKGGAGEAFIHVIAKDRFGYQVDETILRATFKPNEYKSITGTIIVRDRHATNLAWEVSRADIYPK